MSLQPMSRLIILLCIGSVICESRKTAKLRPEVHQPFDYRCPCVPSHSCSHSMTLLSLPCPDAKTVRCCANITSRNARIYLGVEPLTSAITMTDSVSSSAKQEENDTAKETESLNLDKDLEEEIKVDFNIDKLNNRNMKAINLSNVNNINSISEDSKNILNNENKTVLENKTETETESKYEHMIDVDEMLKNSTTLDSLISSNIHKLYEAHNDNEDESKFINVTKNSTKNHENDSVITDKFKLKKVSSIPHVRVSKYQIVYPTRVRDESRKKFIVYPNNESVDNIETDNDTNDTDITGNDDFSDLDVIEVENIRDDYEPETSMGNNEDDNTRDSAREDLEDLEASSNEKMEEKLAEIEAKEMDEEASSSEILEHLIEFGKKMNTEEKSKSDEKELVSILSMVEEPMMVAEIKGNDTTKEKITHTPTLKVTNLNATIENPNEKNINKEDEELETSPIPAASEVVEQIAMPDEPNEKMEVESKSQARIPIRLPSRNLKLQIQGGNHTQIRQNQPKRDNPHLNNNHSNIRDIINSKNYGTKMDLPKPGKNRNPNINPRLKQKVVSETMIPSQSFNLDPNLNEDQEVAETKLVPRGFAPPDNVESGFLPMIDQPDLKIVGPIPRGFQDRSKPNDFQTEDGIRISDLNLPSKRDPPLFFSVFQQGKSNTDDPETLDIIPENEDDHPELPEEEPKDFLSPPNSEVNKSLYETTEDGVYIVQLPLPLEGKVEPFRSEEDLDSQYDEQEDTEIEDEIKTGPSDHFDVDIELESKEDQITPFQLPKNNNQFNLNKFSQNSGRSPENINFQRLPLIDQQDFKTNLDESVNVKNNFLNNQDASVFQTEFESNYPISTSLQLPKSIQTNFLGSQNNQNFEFSSAPLKEKSTQFQSPILNFDSTKNTQSDAGTFQLPVENNPENFQPNLNDDEKSIPFVQKVPQRHTLVFFRNNEKPSDQQEFYVTQKLPENKPFNFAPVLSSQVNNEFRQIPLSQELPSTNTVHFLPTQNEHFNSDVSLEQLNRNKQSSQNIPLNVFSQQNGQQSIPLFQQLPQNKPLRFNELKSTDTNFFSQQNGQQDIPLFQQLPQNKPLRFNELKSTDTNFFSQQNGQQDIPLFQQLPQNKPLRFNELKSTDTNFFSQQNGQQDIPLFQQLPQNKPLRFNELKSTDTNIQRPHLSLIQQLPKSEITDFAEDSEHAKDNAVFRQQLPSSQETKFINRQNNKEVFSQKTVLKNVPVQNSKYQRTPLTRIPVQRIPQKFEFQSGGAQRHQLFKPNSEVNIRPNFNRPNRLPSAQIQLPGKNLVVIRPNEFPSKGLRETVSPNDEKTKYDIALEKYKADIKIYQEQYEAFLKKNFPSAIRIF